MTDEIEVRWKLVEGRQKTGWLAFNFTAVSFDKRNYGSTVNTKEHGEKKFIFCAFCVSI
jgi:hypothetical protein